ncbi:MAG: hypothetical protein WEC58_03400 [Candidatus Paceibacterota bacterium]
MTTSLNGDKFSKSVEAQLRRLGFRADEQCGRRYWVREKKDIWDIWVFRKAGVFIVRRRRRPWMRRSGQYRWQTAKEEKALDWVRGWIKEETDGTLSRKRSRFFARQCLPRPVNQV